MNTTTAILFTTVLALPTTLTCLVGILLNRNDARAFRFEMAAMREGMQAGVQAMRNGYTPTSS